MASPLITSAVRPVDEAPSMAGPTTTYLPAKRHVVEVASKQPRFDMSAIAEHDGNLAQTLHARLDFSKVVNNGCTLAAADAYAVLTPPEFARFEVISSALRSVQQTESNFGTFALVTGAVIAVGATSLAMFSGVPVIGQVFIDAVAAVFGILFVAAAADGGTKSQKKELDAIRGKLAALPAPQKAPEATERR